MTERRHSSFANSIRARLTILSTLTLAVGLLLGAVVFDRLLNNQLLTNLDQQLTSQAIDRSRAIDAGADPSTQLQTLQRETAVAVFAADGAVLANRGFNDPTQLTSIQTGVAVTRGLDLIEVDENEIERYELRVVAAKSASSTVIVASELEAISEPLAAARRLLAVGLPLIALAGAFLLWQVVGRSLRPVEELRNDAQAIAEGHTRGRVGQPDTNDEIGRLASTLNDMLARLERSSDTLRQFVSDSSHEIRSPIANIRARVETGKPADWESVRADVVGEVERVEGIVDDLTFLARSDEGRTLHEPERVDLDEILFYETARLQQRHLVEADASAVEPIMALVDRSQIQRLVRNLVDNAERHAAQAVRLSVRQSPDSRVVLSIEDDGPGVPLRDREHVFERFARLDESRQRQTGGTGLGLAIVQDIAQRHGGAVSVDDSPLGGARFTVTIPG